MVIGDRIGDDIQWGDIAQQAGKAAATTLITQLGPNGQPQTISVPVKNDGIPAPLLYIGAGIAGLVAFKMLTKGSRRSLVSNPRRRRRRRRR